MSDTTVLLPLPHVFQITKEDADASDSIADDAVGKWAVLVNFVVVCCDTAQAANDVVRTVRARNPKAAELFA